MEALPWPAITAASGGWILAFIVLLTGWRKLTSGDLVTRREADAKDAETLRLRESNDHLLEINDDQIAALKKLSDAFDAFRRAAEGKLP